MHKTQEELKAIHASLEKQVIEGYSMYLDDVYLTKLKQEKLYIKTLLEKMASAATQNYRISDSNG